MFNVLELEFIEPEVYEMLKVFHKYFCKFHNLKSPPTLQTFVNALIIKLLKDYCFSKCEVQE